jgi:phosphoglycolate phosphatase
MATTDAVIAEKSITALAIEEAIGATMSRMARMRIGFALPAASAGMSLGFDHRPAVGVNGQAQSPAPPPAAMEAGMKLVIFDCDGTIVDSQHVIVTAMSRAFEAHGCAPLARERVLAVVGLSLPLAIARLLPPATDGVTAAAVAESYRQAFGALRADPAHHEPAYPAAVETIRALASRPDVVLGIATGKSRRGVAAVLERLELTTQFLTIQTADTNPSKPHPAMIRRAMAEAGAEPAATVMVGDTTFDIEMARSAGAGALGVGWGYHPVAELEAAGAHAIAGGYGEVAGLIDAILARAEASR